MCKEFVVGDSGSFSKTISETDVYNFAGICGDFNPVHVNRVYAENSLFAGRIVQGALLNSFISTVLGMYMPGPGTIYLSQESRFVKPVYIGDTVTVNVTIISISKNVVLKTEIFNQKNECVLTGSAKVKLPLGLGSCANTGEEYEG